MKLIIADDERRIRVLIKSIIPFDKLDIDLVYEASDGLQALSSCSEYKPDLLITDINMPGMSGLDLIKELKSILPKLKIIIISGYSDFEYAKTSIRYGVYDYILKPIDEDELINAISNIKSLILEENKNYIEKVKSFKSEKELNNYIHELVQDILNLYDSNSNFNPIEFAKTFIEDNYQYDISLDQLADCVHLNPTYFCGLFKKETGYSYIEYRTITRIEKAKDFLSSSGLTINEISNKIGYMDTKHFCKLFKKLTGMPPSEFRTRQHIK